VRRYLQSSNATLSLLLFDTI